MFNSFILLMLRHNFILFIYIYKHIKNVLSCYILYLYRVIQLICMINFTSKDVYDAIPTIVTTFVAIVAKVSIFIFFLGLVHYTSKSLFSLNYS